MKNYIANVFIHKGGNTERKNFMIKSDSDSEESLKSLIKDQIEVNTEKFEFVEEKFELVTKESVVIFESFWKKISEEKENKTNFDFEKIKQLKKD
jgi:hypothetical protein